MQPTGMFRNFFRNYSTVYTTTKNLFSQSLSSVTRGICLFFLPRTTSALFGAGRSNKLALTSFAAGTTSSPENMELRFSRGLVQADQVPPTFSTFTFSEWNFSLCWRKYIVASFSVDTKFGDFHKHQKTRMIPTDRKDSFQLLYFSSQSERYEKLFWTGRLLGVQ